ALALARHRHARDDDDQAGFYRLEPKPPVLLVLGQVVRLLRAAAMLAAVQGDKLGDLAQLTPAPRPFARRTVGKETQPVGKETQPHQADHQKNSTPHGHHHTPVPQVEEGVLSAGRSRLTSKK